LSLFIGRGLLSHCDDASSIHPRHAISAHEGGTAPTPIQATTRQANEKQDWRPNRGTAYFATNVAILTAKAQAETGSHVHLDAKAIIRPEMGVQTYAAAKDKFKKAPASYTSDDSLAPDSVSDCAALPLNCSASGLLFKFSV
jgi:hypothetical protein